jgi:hypothetical protein
MADAVGQQCLHAAIGEQHLHPSDAPSRGIALLGGGEILAYLARHAAECVEQGHQGAKNGVLM